MTFHAAVDGFKRQLLSETLRQCQGNRTHAALALGLQRTYFLRLLVNHGVQVSTGPSPRKLSDEQVHAIVTRMRAGDPGKAIAADYGVSTQTVYYHARRIMLGETRKRTR